MQTFTTEGEAGLAFASGISANKFAALKEDNLQVIEGIGPKMEELLKRTAF